MKIRRYVMNLTLRAGGSSVRLPTIQELTQRFGVSGPTVCKALKQLSEDGHLIGKPGIGSFTNPAKRSFFSEERQRVIGILVGDGMMVHHDHYMASMLAEVMKQAADRLGLIHLFNLNSHQPEAMLRDILNEQLDALIWIYPPDGMKPVFEKLPFPLVKCGNSAASGNVYFDYEECGRRVGKKLLAEGRRHIVYLPAGEDWCRLLTGIEDVYHEAGIALDETLFLRDPHTCRETLEKLLAQKVPIDAVCYSLAHRYEVTPLLARYGIDTRRQCRVIQAVKSVSDPKHFHGFLFDCDFEAFAREAVDALAQLLEGKDAVRCSAIPLILHEVNL